MKPSDQARLNEAREDGWGAVDEWIESIGGMESLMEGFNDCLIHLMAEECVRLSKHLPKIVYN